MLISICDQFSLNTLFKHRDIHKYTQYQNTRHLKSWIDLVTIKQTCDMMIYLLPTEEQTVDLTIVQSLSKFYVFYRNWSKESTGTKIVTKKDVNNFECLQNKSTVFYIKKDQTKNYTGNKDPQERNTITLNRTSRQQLKKLWNHEKGDKTALVG